jgi:hypothetical protein
LLNLAVWRRFPWHERRIPSFQIRQTIRDPRDREVMLICGVDASALPAGRWHLRFAEGNSHRNTRLAIAAVFLIARTSLGVLLMNIGPPRSKLARTCPPLVFRKLDQPSIRLCSDRR